MKKIYSVTFFRYATCAKDEVSKNDSKYMGPQRIKINCSRDPFLISEDQIDHYMQYGGGIKDMIFVGYMENG